MQDRDGGAPGPSEFRLYPRRDISSDDAAQGVDAELVSLENIVEVATEEEEASGSASSQLGQAFYDRLSKRLGERLLECGDRVPVVTGTLQQLCSLSGTDPPPQGSSVSCQDHSSHKLVEATPISALRCAPLDCQQPSCKYGRKLTASSPPTLARCRPLDYFR